MEKISFSKLLKRFITRAKTLAKQVQKAKKLNAKADSILGRIQP